MVVLMGERDRKISLLRRLIAHLETTMEFAVYYGEDRDAYDAPGRVAHESIFNVNDGSYRCPNSQQGYSPFSTWSRGLAWAILGIAEQLEFVNTLSHSDIAAATSPQWMRQPPRKGASPAAQKASKQMRAQAQRIAQH